MRPALHEMLAPAAIERLTLLINHVLGREPVAMERLKPHAGRVLLLQAEGWPAFLPPWPVLAFRVTPAGLLECGTPEFVMKYFITNGGLTGLFYLVVFAPVGLGLLIQMAYNRLSLPVLLLLFGGMYMKNGGGSREKNQDW